MGAGLLALAIPPSLNHLFEEWLPRGGPSVDWLTSTHGPVEAPVLSWLASTHGHVTLLEA